MKTTDCNQDVKAGFAASHGSANPKRQPCKTCLYFHSTKNAGPDGWCESIEDDVKSWWTGCALHSPKSALCDGDEPPQTLKSKQS